MIATAGPKVDKGLGILEWTGSLVPQGLLVKGMQQLPLTFFTCSSGLA